MKQRQTDDAKRILMMFGRTCPGLPMPEQITEALWQTIQTAAQTLRQSGHQFGELFERVAASDYLMGRKPGQSFRAQLEWVLRPDTVRAIFAGKYDDRRPAEEQPRRRCSFDLEDYDRLALEYMPVFDGGQTKWVRTTNSGC